MRKIALYLILIFLVSGCAMTPDSPVAEEQLRVISGSPAKSSQVGEEAVPEIVEEVQPTALVFAKTQFEGTVKTSYVKLTIVDQEDKSRIFELIIGDKERQQSYPWKVQTVSPGYFFIELPASIYKIRSLSIPVGTTTATEPMDVDFQVVLDKVNYLGTLKVDGTKEKIKLGGVPVIKPGFEYHAQVLDESAEALGEFQKRYPDHEDPIRYEIMQINLQSNVGLKEENS